MNNNISEKLKVLPASPGVYVMENRQGEIIYVGKAKVLKNRVRQYFHSSVKDDKVIAMVGEIFDLHYHITKSEADALILENNLIKKHKPKFNILLKDDKTYPYICFSRGDFEKVYITRKIQKRGGKYFGPFMGGVRATELLSILSEAFKLRVCNLSMTKVPKSHRPCLHFHTMNCLAPCTGKVTEEEYSENVGKAIDFLKGNVKEVLVLLREKMTSCAEMQNFERAIELRDKIATVEKIKDRKITNLAGVGDIDVFAVESNGVSRCLSHLIVRGDRMQGVTNHFLADVSSSDEEAVITFLFDHYEKHTVPDEIVSPFDTLNQFGLKDLLEEKAKKKILFITPQKGLRKQLLETASQNASDHLENAQAEEERTHLRTVGAMELLARHIGVEKKIRRMECFDISNISGTLSVASMAVFEDGEKSPKNYRRFKIKTVEGANDFESMKEVITRRFQNLTGDDPSFSKKPDLVVIDGGKIQLRFAMDALESLGISQDTISLAEREEEVFLPTRELPLSIKKSDLALQSLIRIRDEAHRFAVTYHRTLRNKNALKSALDEIEGVGEMRKKALFERFQTIYEIRDAEISEIAEIKGISLDLAEKIKSHLEQKLQN